jgi:hypothetical protein
VQHTLRRPLGAALGVLILLSLGVSPARAREQRDEEFRYRWQLKNLVGVVAGLFLPNQGEGSLTIATQQNGNLKTELYITSPKSREGEYWRYGSEIDPDTLRAVKAWTSYTFRGETKSRSEQIEKQGVLDIASGIYSIRRDPPARPRRMEIWSDGKVYPVVVVPLGEEMRRLPAGQVRARHYSIRGVAVRGQRRWKGKLDLWLAADEAATPVEIRLSRNLADVHLVLLEPVG